MNPALMVDLDSCIGCGACVAACKVYYGLSKGVSRIKLSRIEKGSFPNVQRLNLPFRCIHCEDPICVEVCPAKALVKTKEGPVIYDPSRCIRCRFCAESCPYGAIQFDEERMVVEKCTMCYDRIMRGLEPVCVSVCPTGALKFGDKEELVAEAKKEGKHVWGASAGQVIYASIRPLEEVGLPKEGEVPAPVYWRLFIVRPTGWALAGLTLVGLFGHFLYWRSKRLKEVGGEEG